MGFPRPYLGFPDRMSHPNFSMKIREGVHMKARLIHTGTKR